MAHFLRTFRYKLNPRAAQYAALGSARFHLKEVRNASLQEWIGSYATAKRIAEISGRERPSDVDWIKARHHEIDAYMQWQTANENTIRNQNDGKARARLARQKKAFAAGKMMGPIQDDIIPWEPLSRDEAEKLFSASPDAFSQGRCIAQLRQDDPDGLGRMPRHVLVNGLRTVEKSMKAFFRRCAAGETPGFPRFKSFDRVHTLECGHGAGMTIKSDTIDRNDRGEIVEGRLISSMWEGAIPISFHRPMPGEPKHVSLTYDGRHWYVLFTVKMDQGAIPEHNAPQTVVGVDLGVNRIATLDSGDFFENPRFERANANERKKLERRLAKTPKKSRARQKAKRALSKSRRSERNRRNTFLHTVSKRLANRAETVVFENLNTKNMVRSAKGTTNQPGRNVKAKTGLNRAIQDSGFATIVEKTRYKAESAGGRVLLVDPRNTSLDCSACGTASKKIKYDLHDCPACGLQLDRDHNAAVNVRDRGIKILGPAFHATRRGALPTGQRADGRNSSAGSGKGSGKRSARVVEKEQRFRS